MFFTQSCPELYGMRVVKYIRCSHDDQVLHGDTLDAQNEILDGVRSHDFDLIIFTKLDRWFRNIADYHRIQEILEANSVQWKAVAESYDTTTTNGRLHINIRLSVVQDECDRGKTYREEDIEKYLLS